MAKMFGSRLPDFIKQVKSPRGEIHVFIYSLLGDGLVVSAYKRIYLCLAVGSAKEFLSPEMFSALFTWNKRFWHWLAHRLLICDCQMLSTSISIFIQLFEILSSGMFLISSIK